MLHKTKSKQRRFTIKKITTSRRNCIIVNKAGTKIKISP